MHNAAASRISEDLLPAFRAEIAAAQRDGNRGHQITVMVNLSSVPNPAHKKHKSYM